MDPVLIFWVLVRVRILFISSPGLDFIYLESGSGFCRCSPGPDFINRESVSRSGSGSGFYPLRVPMFCWSGSGFYPFLSPCPSPEFIKQVRVRVRVRVRILFISSPCPGPNFTKHVRVRVRARSTNTQFIQGSQLLKSTPSSSD